jgi:hypothetical protein
MGAQAGEALEVLREVWRGQGQTAADLDDEAGPVESGTGKSGTGKSCKRMTDVGFDEFGTGEEDLRAAWRAKLAREGKLAPSGGSVRDLVLAPEEPR